MTIRNRTERGGGARAFAGLVGVVGLAGAGALHVAWARGSTWPAADAADLADLVVGRAPTDGDAGPAAMPGAGASVAVAGLLGAAALLTAGASGLVPVGTGRAQHLARLGARTAAGVLLARGSAGLLVSSLGIDGASDRFRTWNRRLYSPLCLGLGSAVAASTRGR
jgi:hypothetical protein